MSYQKLFLSFLSFVSCQLYSIDIFQSARSHSMMNIIQATQMMNNGSMPKDVTHYILQISWQLTQRERDEWRLPFERLNNILKGYVPNPQQLTMTEVMSLTREEKELLLAIDADYRWNMQRLKCSIAYNGSRIESDIVQLPLYIKEKLPLYIKNKFRTNL